MKFFEAVPDELFSPLASPNRALYADALDVLYTAYREKLKLPEDMLYSMLRSRLEQRLAEATFEGEDIDEDELRDISGRARFLIRKLGSKGWFEKERGTDFREYITVPGCSSRLLELFHALREDTPARGYSYVFGTYSTLKVAHESDSVYDKMAAVYGAYDNTRALINLLQMYITTSGIIFRCRSTCTTSGKCSHRTLMIRAEGDWRRTSVRSKSRIPCRNTVCRYKMC